MRYQTVSKQRGGTIGTGGGWGKLNQGGPIGQLQSMVIKIRCRWNNQPSGANHTAKPERSQNGIVEGPRVLGSGTRDRCGHRAWAALCLHTLPVLCTSRPPPPSPHHLAPPNAQSIKPYHSSFFSGRTAHPLQMPNLLGDSIAKCNTFRGDYSPTWTTYGSKLWFESELLG